MSEIFKNLDLNSNHIDGTSYVQILTDAQQPSHAVRRSQAETIADAASQNILVDQSVNASTSTAFTSQSLVNFLSAKQDNMSIHPSSTAYLEILNGTQIRVTRLTTNEVVVDETSGNLTEALGSTCSYSSGWSCNGVPLQTGDVLILENATSAQERSWILNGQDTGTFADFSRLQTDYDEAAIRSMLSAGAFLAYDAGSGTFSLVTGTGVSELGAQTVPMDSTKFTTISVTNTNVEFALLALESLINSVDSNASGGVVTTNTRLSNLAGVSGSNLETFANGLFSNSSNIKAVLQESEALHASSSQDRAAIRAEATAQAATEAALLANEAALRVSGDSTLQTNLDTLSNTQISDKAELNNTINVNNIARINAESALDARLDIIEGDDSTAGSVANAQKTAQDNAQSYTDAQVSAEVAARIAAVNAVDTKVDNLAEGDVTFVGQIQSDSTISIRQERIDAGDTRNGASITNTTLSAGEQFIFGAATDITYTDSSVVSYEQGDILMIVDDVVAGTLVETQVNVAPTNVTGLAISNIGTSTIELDGSNQLGIIADSVGRTELNSAVEADIDDKRSLTSSNAVTSPSDTHFVTDTSTDADQNMYYRRTSNTTDALTGTKRAVLAELYLSTAGSGNPAAPVYGHAATYSSHYQGNCLDLSVAIAGLNAEANANSSSAVYATGHYGLATQTQLGINAGVTGVAQGAGISNIGVTGFGQTGGAGKDRGGVFSLADVDFLSYAALRSANPISDPDVALIADAGYAPTSKAFVAIGDSTLEGNLSVTGDVDFSGNQVIVPNATNDNNAVNLQNIKDKQKIFEFNLTDGVDLVISGQDVEDLDLDKVIWRFINNNTSVDVSVTLDNGSNEITVRADGGSLTGVRLLIQELSCSVTSV